MKPEKPISCVDVIGSLPWGTHVCLFYRAKQDLIDSLVPYFEAGLKNNEFCLWVTADPLDDAEAWARMAEAVPGFDTYVARGQIEIIPYFEWYRIDGVFDSERVLNGWLEKLRKAREKGFGGLRLAGNGSWLEEGDCKGFLEYEKALSDLIGRHNMIALCHFPMDRCDASHILEIVSMHQFALIRRNDEWKIIEDQGQKKARKALQESEDRLRVLTDNLPGINIFQLRRTPDGHYNFSYISQGINAVYNDESGAADTKIQSYLDSIHPDDRTHVIKAMKESYEHLIKTDIVYRSRIRGDDYRWFHSCCVPHRLEDGTTVWDGFSEDVTERKQAEDALKLTQYAMDKMGDMCTRLTPDARIIYVNDTICKTLGYTREELLSMKTFAINPGQHNENNWAEHWNETKKQGSTTFETNLRKKDGSQLPVEITANYQQYGDRDYIIGIKRDITERRRAEETLRESERKFRAIFDQTFQFIGLLTIDGKLMKTNNSALDFIGVRESDVIGKQFWDTPWWTHSRAMQDCLRDAIKKAARGELVRFEATHQAGNGSLHHFDFSIKPVVDESGKVILLIPEGRDITERKQAEKALKEAKAQAELYLDLMGHDINNMHQIALGYLELARDMSAGGNQEDVYDKPITVLQRSARLISNVRKLQKLREGSIQEHTVDVCRVLTEVHREYGTMPGKQIKLSLNGNEHYCVRANELLHDVVANLVGNAIKHTGDQAEISIDLENVTEDGDRYCRVSVEDNGPGIPDDFKMIIFNRMLKGTAQAKGMGLGLYLVKSLVESYNGKVWVEDRVPGDHTQGARFVVMLPAIV
ncbi:MAG TPA: MEDS domain-containing protein [Methanocella sp.]|jgi:PAS domain S-box-containing protein